MKGSAASPLVWPDRQDEKIPVDLKSGTHPVRWALALFALALIPRLLGLRLFLTSDEHTNLYWAGSQFVEGLLSGNLALTYWHFYPGVTMSWVETLGLVAAWALHWLNGGTAETLAQFVRRPILELILAVRLPYALLTAGGVAGFYLLGQRSSGHRTALFGALLIAFDPFLLAHSRVAHGDALVSVFMGLSALAFVVYLQERVKIGAAQPGTAGRSGAGPQNALHLFDGAGRGWLLLSGVMGALAALTKAPGQFMAVFVIMVGVGDWLVQSWQLRRPEWRPRWEARGRLARRWMVDLLLWGGVAAFLFVALWPAMWVDPVGVLARMLNETFGKVSEGHLVFFIGQPTLNPGPWFYAYVIPFRLTPVTLVGVVASLVVLGVKLSVPARQGKQSGLSKEYVTAIFLWVFAISLLLFGNLSPKKQDRYLLPLFPVLDLLAGFAFVQVGKFASQRIDKRENARRRLRNEQTRDRRYAVGIDRHALLLVLGLMLLLLHAFPVVTTYPYYLSYFNPLMGGLPRAVETTLVGWGEGMEKVAAYLNQRPEAEKLYVASVPAQTFLPYFKGNGENFYTNDIAMRADYVVLYISQVQRLAPSPEIVNYFRDMEPEHVVRILGVPYAWIYPGPHLITRDVPSGATEANIGLGDQLRLAGYQIPDIGSPGMDVEVSLYWQALAPMSKNYKVSVRLVAEDGTWLAQHDAPPGGGLLPTSQWRQGDYVRDTHKLEAPPNAIVDHVQVVVYDADSEQPLGAPIDVPVVHSSPE